MAKALNAPKRLPSQELLKRHLDYDPSSGLLRWKERCDVEAFSSSRSLKIWNARYAGEPALNNISASGYRVGRINTTLYYAHRIIWVLVTGQAPDVIDHINGNKADNSWDNLRNVDPCANAQNRKMRADNKSGFNGVYWQKSNRKWMVRLPVSEGRKVVGYFDQFDEAVEARKKAQAELGYHPNHGLMR